MKIQYCSDLHMEFHDNMRFMKSLPLEVVGDVLVIAGDVSYLVDTTIPHRTSHTPSSYIRSYRR